MPGDRASRRPATSRSNAAVKGSLRERPRLASPRVGVPAGLVAAGRASRSESLAAPPALATAHAELAALPPPPAKPLDALAEGRLTAVGMARTAATPLDVVFLEPAPLADVGSRVAGRASAALPQAPIMPIPGEAVNPFSDQGGDRTEPGISIAAAPGQAVAAPDDGRVVFAGAVQELWLALDH